MGLDCLPLWKGFQVDILEPAKDQEANKRTEEHPGDTSRWDDHSPNQGKEGVG
jgi:hypothetical protein